MKTIKDSEEFRTSSPQCNRDKNLKTLWNQVYPGEEVVFEEVYSALLEFRQSILKEGSENDPLWYQKAVVYCLYVDRFAGSFEGLTGRLEYLQGLGVNCLWLLPILDSPMRDEGFDVRNYYAIREELLDPTGINPDPQEFSNFLEEAKSRGIRIIFDLALNHCSKEHSFFREACSNKSSRYRDYFIWSPNPDRFEDCRIIFKGLVESNWSFEPNTKEYYLHRFYPHQPDWNYRNPRVLFQALEIMLHWKSMGIDGFRMDAVPYLWKEEGTNCENLPGTHAILKFLRAAVDFVQPGTLLLAEACQPPTDVVAYFGNGDEVHGAYHFPLMPQIYLALARESSQPLLDILDPRVTPEIPEGTSWFTFLRCHDELTLEMVNNEERALLNEVYCHDPDWSFREGEGISARLADLFQKRALPILLMHSILLTLDGVPILYYGDEFAERNQKKSLEEFESRTGLRDSRALVRGRIDWERVERKLDDPESLESRVFYPLKKMLKIRTQRLTSLREAPQFHKVPQGLCAYSRNLASGEEILFLSNLSAAKRNFNPDPPLSGIDVLTGKKIHTPMILPAYGIFWIEVSENSASSATFD